MKILIMRHTKALSRKEADVPYDADRPLSESGKLEAELLGKVLQKHGIVPNPVVCSPFIRTQETASIVIEQFEEEMSPMPLTILAPGSGSDELLRAAQNFGDTENRWMLAVLHEPDVGYILGSLLFSGRTYPLPVKPGDLFALEIQSHHGHSEGRLAAHFSPAMFLEQ
jgi:phosphohistidine phosphatase